jgi:hypothetical protein
MQTPSSVEVGSRFEPVEESVFRGVRRKVWRVQALSGPYFGLTHATVIDEGNPVNAKTLSTSVLLDPRHYRPAGSPYR